MQQDLFGFDVKLDKDKGYQVLQKRLDNYEKDWCFQYDMRQKLLQEDLFYSGLSLDETLYLKTSDFSFDIVKSEKEKQQCTCFIEKHEWLGTIAPFTTHWFVAKYKNLLAGVILFSEPYNRQVLFDDERYKDVERLISRGACISWSPKNLASTFLMWCIKWMVSNTHYRVFTAYSDPSAKELGTIYQACNFYYLGNKFGKATRYYHPFIKDKIVNSRAFRDVSMYKYAAFLLDVKWNESWACGNTMKWDAIPQDIESKLRAKTIEIEHNATQIPFPSKHKYAYVLGIDKRETKALRCKFEKFNKIYEYPKERGK